MVKLEDKLLHNLEQKVVLSKIKLYAIEYVILEEKMTLLLKYKLNMRKSS